MTFDFKSPPTDNIAYFMAKTKELHFDYDEIMHEAHHKTFTIAKITQIDLLYDIKESLQKALAKGQSFNAWKKDITPTLQKAGWLGKTQVINPTTKETKEIYVGSKRLKTIYYTNIRTSYNQARAREQYNLPHSTYLRYVAIDDNRVRQSHKSLHGLILHRDHAFWKTCYPPNAWNCRCRVQSYSKAQIEKRGWKIASNPPPFTPHKDWSYDTRNLESSTNTLQKALDYKMKYYKHKDIKSYEALKHIEKETKKEVWKQGFNEIWEAYINNDLSSTKRNIAQVGELNTKAIKALREYFNIEAQKIGIVIDKGRLTHTGDRKESYNQHVSKEERERIIDILDSKDIRLFIDTEEKHKNIFFVIDDINDKNKIIKIPIMINHKIKKFGMTNFLVTMSRMDKEELLKIEYKEIK